MATAVATKEPTKKGAQVEAWESFKNDLAQREKEIASLLPQHVSKDRFLSSAVAAVKQTPDLLKCTPRSLFSAVTKSAQDGLLPDGREGVITVYREKQGDDSWAQVAQWNPMTFGLRKRARELDGIIVDAQVVYENDLFIWHQGDDPRIEHKPAQLGTPRGEMIGAYAIIRREGGPVLHREVMDKTQIETVKAQSKAQNGLLWTKFATEAWRKTVVRRGFKSVPCSEVLQTIVQRDDDTFSFDGDAPTAGAKPQKAKPVVVQPAANNGQRKPLPPVVGESEKTIDVAPEPEPAPEPVKEPRAWPLVDHVGDTVETHPDPYKWAEAFCLLLADLAYKLKASKRTIQTYLDNNAETIKALATPEGDAESANLVKRNIDALKDQERL